VGYRIFHSKNSKLCLNTTTKFLVEHHLKEAREAAFVRILTPIQANAVTVLCGHRE
jgi:hypothetical protein